MTRRCAARPGGVLLTVLVVTSVVTILLGGVLAYVSSATRFADRAIGDDICRLAAQSEIELAKGAIYRGFQQSPRMRGAKTIVGGSLGDTSASVFDWFGSYSGGTVRGWVGTGPVVTFDDETEGPGGCRVRVGIGRIVHRTGDQFADVTIVARASRRNAGGSASVVCLAETVHFARQRSKVFDNAYFVNNYGWFQGDGCTANGDVRANGDMYLDASCKVNGSVYAARNDELGVDGNVTGYGKMDSRATYLSSTYGVSNAARPLKTDPKSGVDNGGGYDAPASVSTSEYRRRIHANEALSVEMPYIGDISSDASDYRQWAAELHAADPDKATLKQGGQTLVSVYYDGVGPSGLETVKDTYGNDVMAPDYGAMVLTGTRERPIVLNGPVIIPSDVIISGYVTGQGTIYSGRNIHIVGNIQYLNPPTWSGKSSSGSANAQKDMLGLMAKGNIVMGDYTQSTWMSGIRTYLTQEPYVQRYACDTSDASIGYPATFGGSYAAQEYVAASDYANCSAAGLADFTPGGYDASSGRFARLAKVEVGTGEYETVREPVYDRWGRVTGYQNVRREKTVVESRATYDRAYYETVCDSDEVSSRCSTITRIDAVLYNNHGIFGRLGSCTVNGSLVCRNEGLQYSSKLYLNWDIRLFSGSNETVDNENVGLAKASDNAPRTLAWMQIPPDMAPFAAEGEGD